MSKVIIRGSFWDSYIYSNNLIVICFDGSLLSYKWEDLISARIKNNNRNMIAYKCAFLQSDYLYGIGETDLFADLDIKQLLKEKFNKMEDLYFEPSEIEKFTANKKRIELSNLTIDIGVYNDILYYCNSTGLYERTLRHYNKDQYISTREKKIWDGNAQCLKIGYGGRIALSASSDGIYEINRKYNPYSCKEDACENKEIIQVSNKHSSYCSWANSSLFSGSYSDVDILFGLKYISDDSEKVPNSKHVLQYCGEFNEKAIFKNVLSEALIVSGNEKIYRITPDTIETIVYTQNNIGTDNEVFKYLNQTKCEMKESIICAEVVEFGLIIETNKKLFVFLSNGKTCVFNENEQDEIVRWRVFPRSRCYLNQLHIIYNDRLEVVSFNEDYFVDQDKKIFGQKFKSFFKNKGKNT